MIGHDIQLAIERAVHDQLLALVDQFFEVSMFTNEQAINPVHFSFIPGVDKQAVYQVRKAVAGCAVNRPVLRDLLFSCENLLCDDVVALCAAVFAPREISAALQSLEILLRIVEAVRMVYSQAIDLSFSQQLQNEFMGLLEDVLVFLTQRGQIVDVKESSIVDVIGSHSPICEAIGLCFNELVKNIE